MQTLTKDQWLACPERHLCGTANEIIDNRFAVVAGKLYELVDHFDCENERDYSVLCMYDVEDVFGPDYLTPDHNRESNVVEVHLFDDDPDAALAYFKELVIGRLDKCFG